MAIFCLTPKTFDELCIAADKGGLIIHQLAAEIKRLLGHLRRRFQFRNVDSPALTDLSFGSELLSESLAL